MQKYTAIILSTHNIGEFDRLYLLYTKEAGLVRAIGRGARKPSAKLAGHLEPGTLSEVYIARSRGMGQIASAITVENFENIKYNFEKLEEALRIFRFFAKNFSEEEKDEKIFKLLEDFLIFFNSPNSEKILLEAFWWKLFDFLGHRPEVMKCIFCGRKLEAGQKNFFSVAKGGAICPICRSMNEELFLISENQIKLVRLFLTNPLEKILKVKADGKDLEGLGKIRERFERYNF